MDGTYIIVLVALLSYLAGSTPPILALSLSLKNAETFVSWRLWLLFTPLGARVGPATLGVGGCGERGVQGPPKLGISFSTSISSLMWAAV